MQSGTQIAPVPQRKILAGRIISALAVLFLLVDGLMQVMKLDVAVKTIALLGYPESLVPGIGIVLLVCTLVYVIRRTSILGAILLTGFLGGATAAHVRMGDPLFFFPIVVGMLIWCGLFLRDDRLRALIPLRNADTSAEKPGDQ